MVRGGGGGSRKNAPARRQSAGAASRRRPCQAIFTQQSRLALMHHAAKLPKVSRAGQPPFFGHEMSEEPGARPESPDASGSDRWQGMDAEHPGNLRRLRLARLRSAARMPKSKAAWLTACRKRPCSAARRSRRRSPSCAVRALRRPSSPSRQMDPAPNPPRWLNSRVSSRNKPNGFCVGWILFCGEGDLHVKTL